MSTPEAAVKAKVKALLKKYGAYYFMPATHGYGTSGVPDIVACWRGQFIGIECKAGKGKPTMLQLKNLRDIEKQGGAAILVDETGIDKLSALFGTWHLAEPSQLGNYYNMSKHVIDINEIEAD